MAASPAPKPDARPHAKPAAKPLTKPGIYLVRMLIFLVLIGFLVLILFRQITPAFLANPGLNGLILGVLLIAVLLAFGQVVRLFREVAYVNAVAGGEGAPRAPSLLAPLVPAIEARREGATLPHVRAFLDTVSARLDEGRDALRYVSGILILLGLLGTFWGLIDTLSAVGSVIKSMRGGGGDASVMFDELKNGLAVPLAGIGLAFSASLFGLASSLIIGFLDLQAAQAHARFRNELEDWLISGEEQAVAAMSPVPGPATQELKEAIERLTAIVSEGANGRAATQAMTNLAEGIQGLVQHMRTEQQMIRDWVEAQAARERELKQVLDRLGRERA